MLPESIIEERVRQGRVPETDCRDVTAERRESPTAVRNLPFDLLAEQHAIANQPKLGTKFGPELPHNPADPAPVATDRPGPDQVSPRIGQGRALRLRDHEEFGVERDPRILVMRIEQ